MHGFPQLMASLEHMGESEHAKIAKAYEFARKAHEGVLRKSGEPYITHPVAVAHILSELGLDVDALTAGLLHDTVEDTPVTLEDIEREFGPDVRRIVEGETKVSKLTKLSGQNLQDEQAENLRQMLIAMTGDIRVIIVKLADRLHNMRTLGAMKPEKQQRIARETLEIFAPLAHRLGIGQIKWELEDLSFQYLYPEEYGKLQGQLEQSQEALGGAVACEIEELKTSLGLDGELSRLVSSFDISGRSKHLWSIFQKMQRDGKSLEQIFDLLAIRVILRPHSVLEDEVSLPPIEGESGTDFDARLERATLALEGTREKRVCYQTLGAVHSMWTPIPGRFKDYIAVPKPNGYQSLHTTVISFTGQPIEVQIRSLRMHQIAEFGIAAHWLYKQGDSLEARGNKATWIAQLEQLQFEISDASDFIDAVKDDLLSGRVFVFTPKGETINLPKGATPIDFAYHIHTRVGDTCMGARVNGSIVPLSYELQNGDRVEILTQKNSHPSQDWMNIAVTRSARTKIRHFFRTLERQEALENGHGTLERYLRKRGLAVRQLMRTKNLEDASEKLVGSRNPDDVYLAVSAGRLTPGAVAKVLDPTLEAELTLPPKPVVVSKPRAGGIFIDGVAMQDIKAAHCCNPIVGDPIQGYLTRGRGVTVHRQDCPNLARLRREDPERVQDATWEPRAGGEYAVDLDIVCTDRPGLLSEIITLLANLKKSVLKLEAQVNSGGVAHVFVRLSVRDNNELSLIADALRRVPDVRQVLRLGTGKVARAVEEPNFRA